MASPRRRIVDSAQHAQLGAFVRTCRESMHVSQRDLAKRLNLPQSFVSKIESGERQLQALELFVVCEALGLQPDQVVKDFIASGRKA